MRVSGEGKGFRRGGLQEMRRFCRGDVGFGGRVASIYRGRNVKGLKRWRIKNRLGMRVSRKWRAIKSRHRFEGLGTAGSSSHAWEMVGLSEYKVGRTFKPNLQ